MPPLPADGDATPDPVQRRIELLKRLEIPDCGCPVERIDCGCRAKADECRTQMRLLRSAQERYEAFEDFDHAEELEEEISHLRLSAKYYDSCDCPMILGPPCRCITALADDWPGLTIEEWAAIAASIPLARFGSKPKQRVENGYLEPPPPPPDTALNHSARVAMYTKRHRGLTGLFHPSDILAEKASVRNLEIEGQPRLVNGADLKTFKIRGKHESSGGCNQASKRRTGED